MKKLLPNLTGKKILLLGCGTGEETQLLEEFGAKDIHGIDISEASITLAQATYPAHHFSVGDMHHIDFADSSFDFIYSSLAIHYSETPQTVYDEAFRVLKPGGSFQFSVGHPVRWATELVNIRGDDIIMAGFAIKAEKPRLYGTYSEFKSHEARLPNSQRERIWIGPPSMHFSLLQSAGFTIDNFVETKPDEALMQVDEAYYQRCSRFPQFAVFVATKPL